VLILTVFCSRSNTSGECNAYVSSDVRCFPCTERATCGERLEKDSEEQFDEPHGGMIDD
jgi:hypothetical protein